MSIIEQAKVVYENYPRIIYIAFALGALAGGVLTGLFI